MMYISNTRLFLFFKIWQQTSTADMLDLAVDHIRGLQSELQVCTVRDPLILSCYFFFRYHAWALFSLRGRYCHATLTRKSQLHCLKIEGEKHSKQSRLGVDFLDFSITVGSYPITTSSLCQNISCLTNTIMDFIESISMLPASLQKSNTDFFSFYPLFALRLSRKTRRSVHAAAIIHQGDNTC